MDCVTINGLRFNIEKNLQDFVQLTMHKLLSTNSVSENELKKLQDLAYCKSTFGLKFPLLSKDKDSYAKDDKHLRYYAKETFFENGFYLCNDWYPDKNEKPFSDWLKNLRNK